MKKIMLNNCCAKTTGGWQWLAAASLLSLVGCGGDSGLGYQANDPVNRAPYFSVAGQAVENGSSLDATKTKPLSLKFFDDEGLASYYFEIGGEKIAAGELTGTSGTVDINLEQLEGENTYSAKLLTVDAANQSTLAYFTINIKAYYEFMALIGGATPNGWDISAPTFMTKTADPAIFYWEGELTAGEFKIATSEVPDWCSGDWLHPLSADQSLASTGYDALPGCGLDHKWSVAEGQQGLYSITINQKDKTIKIGKPMADVYIVGSATPTGWNLGAATALQRDASDITRFTTTIALAAGEFKFASQTASWETGYWLYAPSGAAPLPQATGGFDLRQSGAPDNKWSVSAAEAGTYTITLDLDAGTIIAEKQ